MDEYLLFFICSLVPAVISAALCLFIILVYLANSSLQNFSFRQVIILNTFDLFQCLGFMIPTFIDSPALCLIQAAAIQFFGLCSTLWTLVVCLILYNQVVSKKNNITKLSKIYLFTTILASAVVTISAFALEIFGRVEGHCWIIQTDLGLICRFLFLFIPGLIVIGFNSFAYFRIIARLKKESFISKSLEGIAKSLIDRIKLYPIAMAVLLIPLICYRFVQEFYTDNWVYIISLVMYNSIGGANALIYGFNEAVKLIVTRRSIIIEPEDDNEISLYP